MPDPLQTVFLVVAVAAIVFVILLLLRRSARPSDTAETVSAAPPPSPTAPVQDSAPLAAAPPAASADTADSDELTQIKGLGPKAAGLLNQRGIARFDQIAGWTESDIEAIGAALGGRQERIARDRWIEQAGLLARGEIALFEKHFGKLG
jgi:predicted flap endonuclease-1-like 5' DNA nuclease